MKPERVPTARLAARATGASFALLALLFALAGSANAQDTVTTPRSEVFIGASWMIQGVNDEDVRRNYVGLGFGVTSNFGRWAGVAFDFSSVYNRPKEWEYTYLVGPRFSLRRERATGFAHLLFGGSTATFGGGSDTDPAVALGGGVDINMNSRTAIRGQVDYLPIFGGGTLHSIRVTGGVVFKLGGR